MQNVVGPTLVATATKFGLGAEIQSPTGLLFYLLLFAMIYMVNKVEYIVRVWMWMQMFALLIGGHEVIVEGKCHLRCLLWRR